MTYNADLESVEKARAEGEAINALRTELPGGGYLSNLVWNTRNEYLAWPDGTFSARRMRLVVEGFLAEIATLKEQPTNGSNEGQSERGPK